MTLDFARKEAQRRTAALQTTHYVIKTVTTPELDGYIVTARVPLGYTPVATYPGTKAPEPIPANDEICRHCGAILPF